MRKRIPLLVLALTIVLTGGFFALKVLNYGRPLFAPAPGDFSTIGQPIVTALADYKEKHGRYPPSLEEAEIRNIDSAYGPFRYQSLDNGKRCNLVIGSYSDYLFEVTWTSDAGWYVDS